MEPQLSVLLYSKYSVHSKKLMDMMIMSGIDFKQAAALDSVCIDNKHVRDRILKNQQIVVETVPCLLLVYPDGGLEKYDGESVFNWVERIIQQFLPPQQQTPQQQTPPRQQTPPQPPQKPKPKKTKSQHRRQRVEPPSDYEEEDYEEGEEYRSKITAITDLPSDEEDDRISDRFKARKPIKTLRSDSGNYAQNDEFFEGEVPDMRRPTKSSIKTATKLATKSGDIMAKAREMEKSREVPVGRAPII